MKKRIYQKLTLFVMLSFIFISCTPFLHPNDDPLLDQSSTTSARVIESYDDLPTASMNNKGQLYYVINDAKFYYSNGSSWKQIDLSGSAGPAGPAGPVGPAGGSLGGTAKAYDANNVELGYCYGSGFSLQMISPTGYYYNLLWNGIVLDYICYYTDLNQSGVMFFQYPQPIKASNVFRIGSKYYTFRDSDIYGNAISDPSITSYSSIYSQGYVTNLTSAQNISSTSVYVFKEISLAEAGIPSTITLPITIKYEWELELQRDVYRAL